MNWILAAFLLFNWPQYTQRPQAQIRASHIGPNAVAIACLNGADPTANKVGEVLIVSCGK